jgi:hypothetical protein
LTPGEYELPAENTGGESDSTFSGRVLFSFAVFMLNWQKFEPLIELSKTSPPLPAPWEDPEGLVGAFLTSIEGSLKHWSVQIGVEDDWFLASARVFVLIVNRQETTPEGYKPYLTGVSDLIEQATKARQVIASRPLTIEVPSWDPLIETQQEFVERATRLSRESIQAYCAERRDEAEQAGFAKTPEKRGGFEPFFWLAGHQTRNWSAARIAGAANRERTAVEKQIQKTAREIGLTLRPVERYDRTQTIEMIRESLKIQSELTHIDFSMEQISPALTRILPPGIRDLLG